MRDDGVGEESLAGLIESANAAERAGAWDQALVRFEAAFSRLRTEGDAGVAAELLRRIGHVRRERGELELAHELYEASLALARATRQDDQAASALTGLGIVEQYRGDLDRAEQLYRESRSLADAVGKQRLAAMTDLNLGTIANIRGDLAAALASYQSALARFEVLDDDVMSAGCLTNIGMAHVDLGQWELATAAYQEAFARAQRAGDSAAIAAVELNRAELHLKRDEHPQARDSCDRVFEIASQMGSQLWQAEAHKLYGVLYRETDKPFLAESHLAQAVELAKASQNRLLEAEAELERALVFLELKRNSEALRALNSSHQLFWKLQARRDIVDLNRRLDRLEDAFLRVTEEWGESIESKDEYTAGHCRRVADYACLLAERFGVTGRELTWFRMGAFLHDVGKLDTPAEVLNKPGKLDPEEWERMKRHTVVGDEIVRELDFPWDIRPMVRSHHERWDGSGYPDGLVAEEIPLLARILCVADVYDALTSARSYRPAMSHQRAREIMDGDVGRIFEPALLAAFWELREGQLSALRAA